MNTDRLALPVALGWVMVPAGLLAIFATYWDEAWHSDVGRDADWSAPHLLLYGSVGIVGLGVAYWGLRQLLDSRSLRGSLANLPLVAASLGALGALVAAPIDVFWHETYGRDAVLWSPPHMLALLGSIALGLGVAAGIPVGHRILRAAASVLVLANAVTVVFEYEADVPQFHEGFYLPLLIVVSLAVAVVVEQLLGRTGVAAVVVAYVVARLAVAVGLLALDRSTPDLPIAILGLTLWSLPFRSRLQRAAAAAAGIAALALVASAVGAASQPVDAVAIVAAPVLVGAGLVAMARRTRLLAAAAVLAGFAAVTVAPAEPAAAHDPGQGDPVVPAVLSGHGGHGRLTITAIVEGPCDDLDPLRVVARRAGRTLTAPLMATSAGCTFRGDLVVPSSGRWFTYVEFRDGGETIEAWLPLDAYSAATVTQSRDLYLPAGGGQDVGATQAVWGAGIYLVGLALVGLGVVAVRKDDRAALPASA